ncbi:MAG TPA: AbrB/MazE/SpoVT family DNA-binding domain-containing protein [Longimicrobiales bacterium]
MRARVQKWGNSLAVRIPRAFAEEARLAEGTEVDMSVTGAGLVVRPVARHRYSLDELLAGVTDDNIHAEVDWGRPVGKEIW